MLNAVGRETEPGESVNTTSMSTTDFKELAPARIDVAVLRKIPFPLGNLTLCSESLQPVG